MLPAHVGPIGVAAWLRRHSSWPQMNQAAAAIMIGTGERELTYRPQASLSLGGRYSHPYNCQWSRKVEHLGHPSVRSAGVLPLGACTASYDATIEHRFADHRRGRPQAGSASERLLWRRSAGWRSGRSGTGRLARCPWQTLHRPAVASLRQHGRYTAVHG